MEGMVSVVGMLAAEAERRGILCGNRAAIISRLGKYGDSIPISISGNRYTVPVFPPFPPLRSIGDAFWHARSTAVSDRRRAGSFYTPDPLIDSILNLVWRDIFPAGLRRLGTRTVCDPALGCGFFFLRLVETLLNRGVPRARIRSWAARSLFGVDTDAEAVFLAKALLWLALSEGKREFVPPAEHFVVGDSLLGTQLFPEAAAADGDAFDCVLGNPPYEVLTNFSRHPEQKQLADALRRSGLYADALSGQINLYRCFIERGLGLLRPGGVLSFVVPLSLTRDGAAASLRRRLLEEEATAEWTLYGEKERLFAGVTQSACVFRAVRGGGAVRSVAIAVGGRGGSGDRSGNIPFAELRKYGDGLALPGLNARGLALWRRLHRQCPGRISDCAEARVGEVDQTVYRACMLERNTGVLLARGAHVSAFRVDVEAQEEAERFLDLPRFLAMKGAGAETVSRRAGETRVAQLGIRNMQSRPRLVAALLPPGVYAGNSLNVYTMLPGTDAEFVAGVLNSSLLDWLFRAVSGNNNINLREMRALPFPSRASTEQRAAVSSRYRDCAQAALRGEDTAQPRAALNAAVAACYAVPENMSAEALEALLLI